jgi:ABC-type phosphate/phosphonate transport system substrate-binding protein
MSRFIANARMYAVTPEAETAWRELLAHIFADAGIDFDYLPYPAPQPLEDLWRRPDLGCVQMCGFPIAMRLADVVPIAAPIPHADWARGRAVYRSDLIVRSDAPYRTLADTFTGRLGWTVRHSHSGFNALRHHLVALRTSERPRLYNNVLGDLITARRILDSVRDGSIDVGPLDAYWHMLIRRWQPELADGMRVLESTETAPMPAFVAAAELPPALVEALQRAFAGAAARPWFGGFADALLLDGFVAVDVASFAKTRAWHDAALRAGYPLPA